jgi:rRNA maturation protein Nop10
MKTWRERLDARIDRCPGCDQWRFDQKCSQCGQTEQAS